MSSRLVFSIDLNRCINCKTCEMACNDFYGLMGNHRRNVVTFETEADLHPLHISISCNHCMNPVCLYICPENNFQVREDGIVVHNPSRCKGCQRCIEACPFDALKLNPQTNCADKCNFCIDRIEQGMRPICVENCITSALSIIKVDANEMKSNHFQDADIPIVAYTNPSIHILKKQKGQIFLREG
ncbi:4Fe-4S dicluster domain-containing protein [Bacillus benzoevorans]|uniref:Fe-S-cluster-containing dehydrogenase component n=1 Tax=Bacillus benzoevorans TaxID=1456 RepID=A0A7X0LWG0_9BACI|nr:4Fe-4S dicluster domain-containing protein [Bacillus benzoevorans]MBB6446620.1 Fe-S-cluster-containing dehydrogenase component [Bacillus benzoevorans]